MVRRDGEGPRSDIQGRCPRRGRARAAGDLVGDIGGVSFSRFGFVQSAIVSRWGEIVGERYANVSTPESIRFPAGQEVGRDADPDRRRRPCPADAAPHPADRRAGQPLLRLCRGRPDRLSPGPRRRASRAGPPGAARRCRASLARACAKSPTPGFAPASNRSRREFVTSAAAAVADRRPTPFPPLRSNHP